TTDVYDQVMMVPLVVDVNGDGVPDVLASFFGPAGYDGPGVIRALSGGDGTLLWTSMDAPAVNVHPPSSLAAVDLEGSGQVTVVGVGASGQLLAFEGKTGAPKWASHDAQGQAVTCAAQWG